MGNGRGTRERRAKGPRGQDCSSHRVRRRNSCGQQTGWTRKSGAACLHRWLGGWERPGGQRFLQPGIPEHLQGEVCHRSGGKAWKVEGLVCQG